MSLDDSTVSGGTFGAWSNVIFPARRLQMFQIVTKLTTGDKSLLRSYWGQLSGGGHGQQDRQQQK